MVGNGVTDETYDGNALVPFAHGMGLISNELYQVQKEFPFYGMGDFSSLQLIYMTHSSVIVQDIITECEGNYYNPTSDGCDRLLSKVNEVISPHISKY